MQFERSLTVRSTNYRINCLVFLWHLHLRGVFNFSTLVWYMNINTLKYTHYTDYLLV